MLDDNNIQDGNVVQDITGLNQGIVDPMLQTDDDLLDLNAGLNAGSMGATSTIDLAEPSGDVGIGIEPDPFASEPPTDDGSNDLPIAKPTTADPADTSIDDAKGTSDNPTDKDDGESAVDYTDYTATSLEVKYMEELGFKIYDEVPKDLTTQKFATDLPVYINNVATTMVEEKVKEYDRYVDYLKLRDQGVAEEAYEPALKMEKYAAINIDDPNTTEEQLVDVIKNMYIARQLGEQEAEVLANNAKAGDLKGSAAQAVEFFDANISSIKEKALNDYNQKQIDDQNHLKEVHDSFTSVLESPTLRDMELPVEERQRIYDAAYKRDQLVTWGEGDQQESAYVSQFELAMHEIEQNPEMKALFLYNYLNNFSGASASRDAVAAEVNSTILKELESRRSNPTTNKENNTINQGIKSPVSSIGQKGFINVG